MSMKNGFLLSLLAFILFACSKDKFETKPSLKYKSASTHIVPMGSGLQVNLEFTDKEGDLDSVFIIRERLNKRGPLINNSLQLAFPSSFNNETKGELILNLDYGGRLTYQINGISIPGSGGAYEPDTLLLKFVIKDKAKNYSDTAQKDFIVIR